MAQEFHDKYFKIMSDYFKQRIEMRIGSVPSVYYSAYVTDSCGVPVNNLDDIAIKGNVKFVQEYEPFWDEEGNGKKYESKEMKDPTWIDVTVLADEMIRTTGDKYHMFLEGVYMNADGKTYGFSMGS